MSKEEEIMEYLHKKVFDPVLNSTTASKELKSGARLTIMRLNNLDAKGMIKYFWSAIVGTDRSIDFSERIKREGFDRFEEVLEEFRVKFDDAFLRRK